MFPHRLLLRVLDCYDSIQLLTYLRHMFYLLEIYRCSPFPPLLYLNFSHTSLIEWLELWGMKRFWKSTPENRILEHVQLCFHLVSMLRWMTESTVQSSNENKRRLQEFRHMLRGKHACALPSCNNKDNLKRCKWYSLLCLQ